MRRRKNIIVSAITCMFSLCLMMIGVYAASSPSVSINGQVSYTARDASVLVQGKTYGADGYETGEYKEITDPTSPKTSDVLTNSVSQYLDYTSADQNKTTLATWDLGNQLKFYEDQNGIRKVYVYLKFTNLSNYPITASAKFESKTATNVKTTQSPSDGKMAMTTVGNVGSDCEMSFAFEVEDDSKNASIDFTLVITIEKTVLQSYTATFSSGTKQFTNQSNGSNGVGRSAGVVLFGKRWRKARSILVRQPGMPRRADQVPVRFKREQNVLFGMGTKHKNIQLFRLGKRRSSIF